MIEFDIIINIYFSGVLNKENIKSLVDYTAIKSRLIYGKELESISYSSLKDKREKNKALKLNPKNLSKFYKDTQEEVLKSFEVYNLSNNSNFKARDNDFSLNYASENEFVKQSSIMLQLNGDSVSEELTVNKLKEIVNDLINFLTNHNMRIKYGFIFPMERDKFPKFFAAGIGSENLTKEEKEQTYIWGNNQNLCGEKVWDVFWGNIITSNHLIDNFPEKELIKLFGEENVINKVEGLYICYLPTDIFSFRNDKSKMNKYREKIKKIFSEYDMIIETKPPLTRGCN